MGDFRIVVEAVGGHGCERDKKDGDVVVGCGQTFCPDCITRRYIKELRGSSSLNKAELTHWPADMPNRGYTIERQVQDDLLTGVRKGSF